MDQILSTTKELAIRDSKGIAICWSYEETSFYALLEVILFLLIVWMTISMDQFLSTTKELEIQ